jgi:DNA-binding NarL/FixJ family response regulator
MIRVAIADDQDLVRIGLRVLVETEDDLALAGEATNGQVALELIRRTRPDIVLMDIRMPVMDGIEAMQAIAADHQLASTRVIMLTTFELDEYVFGALRAGASGFLTKDASPADLLAAIRTVAAGDSLLSPSVTRRVIREFATGAHRVGPHPQIHRLTAREREIVTLAAEGLTNHEIAERLVLSPATVRTHVSRAMTKLGARDRAQLVVFAYQSQLAPGNNAHHKA